MISQGKPSGFVGTGLIPAQGEEAKCNSVWAGFIPMGFNFRMRNRGGFTRRVYFSLSLLGPPPSFRRSLSRNPAQRLPRWIPAKSLRE
jgi:hypothetical protein